MLSVVAQAPVESLETAQNAYVTTAENILNEVLRELNSQEWWFTTEYSVVASPDADGFISLGSNVVSVDDSTGVYNWTKRGDRLYDLDNHSFEFTGDVTLDIVYALEWDDMPIAAKNYAVKRAARILNDRLFRDPVIQRAASFDENIAWQALVVENSRQADYNLFNNPELSVGLLYQSRSPIEGGWV